MSTRGSNSEPIPFSCRLAHEWIAVPSVTDDKYSRGVLGVITGSDEYPGAGVLSVEAACRTGIGMVRYSASPRAADFVLHRRPEVVTVAGRVQAWLIGSGMTSEGTDPTTNDAIHAALSENVPMVLDAGALHLSSVAGAPTVITPHFRELAATLSENGLDCAASDISENPVDFAREAAQRLGVTVLLKGNTSYAASPAGELFAISGAPTWLAIAGSGDVLAGILGALVATHSEQIEADAAGTLVRLAAAAALIHGSAARKASSGGPITALDVAETVPLAIASILTNPPRA